jgi:hypothetical protein
MAILNFPADPVVGQFYDHPDAGQYLWNGYAWERAHAESDDRFVTISGDQRVDGVKTFTSPISGDITGEAASSLSTDSLNADLAYTAKGFLGTDNILEVSPTGNPTGVTGITPTYASVVAQTTTTKGITNREWTAIFGLTNTQGYGAANNNGDKVALYSGIVASGPAAGDSWAFNTVLTVDADAPAGLKAHGYECDVNNLQGHRDDYGNNAIFGVSSTGAGPYRCTAAFLVSGVNTNWQRGLAISSVNGASIEDTSNSQTSYDLFGTHNIGMDLSHSVCTTGIKLGANTITGNSGIIGTSDRRTKNSIEDSDLGLDFVMSLRPVSYRHNVGKNIIPEGGTYKDIQPVPGTRRHYGLLADEVKQAIPEGKDFAGWVLTDPSDPDSQQGLRYDQFIAPLIKAIHELKAEIEVLKAAK